MTTIMTMAKVFFLALISLVALQQSLVNATFATNAKCTWGYNNCQLSDDSLQLILNQWSGAAVVGNNEFVYGSVEMKIKLVPGNAAAVVTTYYISSAWTGKTTDVHDEIDFEFLGNATGRGNFYTLHTNIFVDGVGGKEEQFRMSWYNPTSNYHNYKILWTPYMVVWYVDGNPIRVYKNYEDKGIPFPKMRPQKVYSSIWNADDWACQGGRIKTNWTYQPFVANYKTYVENVCLATTGDDNSVKACNSPSKWYYNSKYIQLSPTKLDVMNSIRSKWLVYSYCKDTKRFNGNMPPECSLPQQ